MAWVIRRRSEDWEGTTQFVQDLTGVSEEEWEIVELDCEPTDNQRYDWEAGELCECPVLGAALRVAQKPKLMREEYVYNVIRTLFPDLEIPPEVKETLFPQLPTEAEAAAIAAAEAAESEDDPPED